jgi:non-ribosomal peptide synthetase component E (peptide arylation enzyme)
MKQLPNILIMNVMFLKVYQLYIITFDTSSTILGEQKRYTFKSFKDEVDCLAASLLELGFEKNDRLAVWLPNTSENVTTTFVASKLGLIKVKPLLYLKRSVVIIILG